MHSVIALLNLLFGIAVRTRAHVSCGNGSIVRWWGLRGCRSGNVSIGSGSMVKCKIMFDHPGASIKIGDRTSIGASLLVCHTKITIGNDVLISWGVTIVDHDSHSLDWRRRAKDVSDWMAGRKDWEGVSIQPVTIGDRAWIGFGVTILKGVTVGEGAIIGACAVVTKDVPPYAVLVGNPARIIRYLT